MPIIRVVKNKAGAEAFAIGISDKDMHMLRAHGMCQLDVRTFVTGIASIILVHASTEEQCLDMIDPAQKAIVVNVDKQLSGSGLILPVDAKKD